MDANTQREATDQVVGKELRQRGERESSAQSTDLRPRRQRWCGDIFARNKGHSSWRSDHLALHDSFDFTRGAYSAAGDEEVSRCIEQWLIGHPARPMSNRIPCDAR